MKSLTCIMALVIAAPIAFTACDRTVAEKTSTSSGPNGTVTEKKEVVQHNDGTVTESKEKSVSNNP